MVYVLTEGIDGNLLCVCDSKETAYNEALDFIDFLPPEELKSEIKELKEYVNSKYENFFGLAISIYELPFFTKADTSSL